MGFERNTLTDEQYKQRLNALMPELIKTHNPNKEQAKELFFLYNDRLTPRETKIDCGGCRSRVFKRMLTYYNEINA